MFGLTSRVDGFITFFIVIIFCVCGGGLRKHLCENTCSMQLLKVKFFWVLYRWWQLLTAVPGLPNYKMAAARNPCNNYIMFLRPLCGLHSVCLSVCGQPWFKVTKTLSLNLAQF